MCDSHTGLVFSIFSVYHYFNHWHSLLIYSGITERTLATLFTPASLKHLCARSPPPPWCSWYLCSLFSLVFMVSVHSLPPLCSWYLCSLSLLLCSYLFLLSPVVFMLFEVSCLAVLQHLFLNLQMGGGFIFMSSLILTTFVSPLEWMRPPLQWGDVPTLCKHRRLPHFS